MADSPEEKGSYLPGKPEVQAARPQDWNQEGQEWSEFFKRKYPGNHSINPAEEHLSLVNMKKD